MNAKKVKQLRKVARGLKKVDEGHYYDNKGTIHLNRFSEKGLIKELKKSFNNKKPRKGLNYFMLL